MYNNTLVSVDTPPCLMGGLIVRSSKMTLMGIGIDSIEETSVLTVLTHTHLSLNYENNKSNSVDVINPSVYQFVMAQDTCTHFHLQSITHTQTPSHTPKLELVYYDVH